MDQKTNLLQILLDHDIEFIIVGGMAAVLHGCSQVTHDLDICAPLTPEQITRLRDILKELNPRHRMTPQKLSFQDHPENLSNIKNLYLQTDLGVLDMISSVSGVGDFKRIESKAISAPLFNKTCRIISIEDLISAKQYMGRPKDLATIQELNVIKSSFHK